MPYQLQKKTIILFLVAAVSCLVGCSSGAKVLKEPSALQILEPLSTTRDKKLIATLDWVIVRDGPGTWARNADWDEYLLRVRNSSGKSVRIISIAVYDSLDRRLESSGNRVDLVKLSKETTRRYRDKGLKVKAGMGAETYVAAASGVYLVGAGTAYAALTGSASAVAAAGTVAVGVVVLVPGLIVAGVYRGINDTQVMQRILDRQTPLPVVLAPAEEKSIDLFFPLAPSPKKLELTYLDSGGEYLLVIELSEILRGLHIGNTDNPENNEEGA